MGAGGGTDTLKDVEPRFCKLYLFEFLDEPSSFDAALHVEANVHLHLSEGVGQFDDGNLRTDITDT